MNLLVLDATTKSLTGVLAVAVTANQPEFTVHYMDVTATTATEGNANGTFTSGSTVTILAAPGASTRRVVRELTVYNKDTQPITFTLALLSGATSYIMVKEAVGVGQKWCMSSGHTEFEPVISVLGAVHGGTGVANTGTITSGSNITFTGGGTIALAGYTLTIPATGTPALLATANTFTASNNNFQGTTANDLPTYSAEFLDDANWTLGAGWSGSFVGGFTHTSGSGTATLTHDHPAVSTTKYQIAYTVTGMTTGTFTIAFGGQSIASLNATGVWGPTAANTNALTVTPTDLFNGTVVISIKSLTAVSTALINIRNSAGTVMSEIRGGNSNTNVFIGLGSGRYNTTGTGNSAQGAYALYSNTTGTGNSAQGAYALQNNTTGTSNSTQGVSALYSNTTGAYNSAQGVSALYSNTTGISNSAQGVSALQNNTTGAYNSAQGVNALYSNTTGTHNSAQGMSAGRTLTTGTNNTFLGYYAGYHASQKGDAANSMALGANSYTTADNQIVIGDTNITSTVIRGAISILANNIVTDTTTGMKIGTATNQKVGFFNATPVVQQSYTAISNPPTQAEVTAIRTALINLGLMAAS